MSKKEVRSHIISIISVSLFLIFMTAFVYLPKQENLLASFAFLQRERNFYMEELTDGVLLHDASPVRDETGLKNDAYRFKVVNNSNSDITYKIAFKSDEVKAKEKGMEILPNRYLRYTIYQENTNIESKTLAEDGILYIGTVLANSEIVFNFKMWLSIDADNGAMNKIFIGRIELQQTK